MSSAKVNWKNFNRHMFSGEKSLDVSQVLNIRRSGEPQPFVARYFLDGSTTSLAPALIVDWFVPMVQMAARDPHERILDGKSFLRGKTSLGSISIRDRRIEAYNVRAPVNNVSFYIPMSELALVTDRLHAPRIDALPNLLDRDHYDAVMFHFANMMMQALERPAEASPLFLDHLFDAVCVHIATTYGGLVIREPQRRGALSPLQERRITGLLQQDLRGELRLEELATSCGMSRGHFIRAFKQSTGLPPHQWLLSQRVHRAQALLPDTRLPISQIALECGFADQSHLTRVFTKIVGASPAAWRRDRRE